MGNSNCNSVNPQNPPKDGCSSIPMKSGLVFDFQKDALQSKQKDKFTRRMLCGSFWIIGGALVTVLSMGDTKAGVIQYVFWGATVWLKDKFQQQ